MRPDPYEVALLAGGLAAFAAAWAPTWIRRRAVSMPMVLVAFGIGAFALPLGLPAFDAEQHLDIGERLTEAGVVISLMGAGLRIDRAPTWAGWTSTRRLLVVGMPLSIVAVAALGGWALGLPLASAVLLGAVLAPTDPVLAEDVQVGGPSVGDTDSQEDEVRFALTSEAGLNDALAFPFVYLAIRFLSDGPDAGVLLEWFAVDVLYRVGAGGAVGFGLGWLIGRLSFAPPGRLPALARNPQGFVAIAAVLLAYGGAEVLGGYGFLAVFVAAVVLRSSRRHHEFHDELHRFVEQSEQLVVVGLLVLLGGAVVGGVLAGLSWAAVAVAVVAVVVIRPVAAGLALIRCPLPKRERLAIAVFGVKGIGSLYYLAYALADHDLEGASVLWATVVLVILISVVVHGVAATPVMALLDHRRAPASSADE